MAKIPSVFIVDQDPDARFLTGRAVHDVEFATAGEAGLGTEAVALACDSQPDIVLVGVKEPVARVLQTIESLVHALPQAPVIAYAEQDGVEFIRRMMLAGARDFLRTPFKPEELKQSLIAGLESEERRRLRDAGVAAVGPRAITIGVFGAKGGIGKTTLATNLGVALARAGHSAALVDMDDTFGDAAASLALSPERSVIDLIQADGTSQGGTNGAADGCHESGLEVLSAPADPLSWNDVSADHVRAALQALGRKFDVVVADTSGSLSQRTLAVLEEASTVLWVTTPDYASVRDTLQAMRAINKMELIPEDRIRLVLNVSSPDLDVRPESIEEALAMPIFWMIPYEPRLRRSGQLGQAFVDAQPKSSWSESVVGLSRALSGRQQEEVGRGRSLQSLFAALKFRIPGSESLAMRGEGRP